MHNAVQQSLVLRTLHNTVQEMWFSDTPYDEIDRKVFNLR